MNKTTKTVFTGASGVGNRTQIHAFASFLLGGDADESARILLIDDRDLTQYESVAQLLTCFRHSIARACH